MDPDWVAKFFPTSRKPRAPTPVLHPPLASLLSRLCGKSPTNLSNPGFGTPRVPFAARKTSNSERGKESGQPCPRVGENRRFVRTRLSALLSLRRHEKEARSSSRR